MKVIDAAALDYKTLNEVLRQPEHDYVIEGCCGQRFIGAGMSDRNITVNGISGNALGAYLNNASITVNANAQDAVGDTMNAGKILIHGSAGDAVGYAMRGGKIYVRDHAGYRAGIHMKEYKKKVPIMIIGRMRRQFSGGISGRRDSDCIRITGRSSSDHRQFPLYRYARRKAVSAGRLQESEISSAGDGRYCFF